MRNGRYRICEVCGVVASRTIRIARNGQNLFHHFRECARDSRLSRDCSRYSSTITGENDSLQAVALQRGFAEQCPDAAFARRRIGILTRSAEVVVSPTCRPERFTRSEHRRFSWHRARSRQVRHPLGEADEGSLDLPAHRQSTRSSTLARNFPRKPLKSHVHCGDALEAKELNPPNLQGPAGIAVFGFF